MLLSSAQPDHDPTQSGCKINAPARVSDTLGRYFFSETKLRSSAVADSSAARLGFSTHYQPARGAPGRIRSTIMLEGYLLKYASSSKRISSGAKSRMLVFTTSKGLKYGPLNASRVKKLAWGDIARCQQVANNDVCFVVVTNREKEIWI